MSETPTGRRIGLTPREPRNWFFTLLVPAGVVFVITAIALAVIPVLEDRAVRAGSTPPPSIIRDALREDGWWWILIEVGVVIALSIMAMIWDRFVIQSRHI
jgi:hypothetical protein